MRSVFSKKTAAFVLALVLALSMFSGCGQQAEVPALEEIVDAAVKAALDATAVPTNITIEVDGKKITVEDAANITIEDLLDQADIVLNEGDYLTVSPTQTLSGNITLQVVRVYSVTVVMAAENPEDEIRYTAHLSEGTVADALAAVGVVLAENQTIDAELDQALENGMVITVTTEIIEEETVPEATVPETTEPAATSSSSNSSSNSSSSSSSSSKPKETKPKETKPKETKPKETKPKETKPKETKPKETKPKETKPKETTPPETKPKETTPPETKPKETKPKKTVVNVEYYEDCDGSGHGVKVITYSDGSQEEVPY